MSSNFVDIVGYQLEKVHTGMIKWLLEEKSNSDPMNDKRFGIIKRIYTIAGKNPDFFAQNICQIKCIPEFSFGRKRKVDLVVEIHLNDGTYRYLVMEMKVDSIPEENQLVGTCNDFIDKDVHTYSNTIFLLLLFGTAQVCQQPSGNNHKFYTLILDDIINVFDKLYINDANYTDWISSLKMENKRKEKVLDYVEQSNNLWDEEYWKNKGYRIWFPLFYYIYNGIREKSKRKGEWEIYSGSNNPVMNWWGKGWINKSKYGYNFSLYWEFNYQDFILKISLDDKNKMDRLTLGRVRNEISNICKAMNSNRGTETQNRYGSFVSIYKWQFDFKKEDFNDIINEADNILDTIYPQLQNY